MAIKKILPTAAAVGALVAPPAEAPPPKDPPRPAAIVTAPKPQKSGTTYTEKYTPDDHRAAMAERSLKKAADAQEIGPLPECADLAMRARVTESLLAWCMEIFPEKFYLGMSPDHLEMIERLEKTILGGGLNAYACPRGFGKTTITVAAAEWALICGHRGYLVVVASTADKAGSLLDGIKMDLRHNPRLLYLFPEVIYPIRKMEGQAKRCIGQKLNGEHTSMQWNQKVVFPTVEGSKASAAIMATAGLTGSIRGEQYVTQDGRVLRPDILILDDPQTTESANSITQTKQRVKLLNGDVLNLGGHDRKVAAFMPCTVIAPEDMAEQILDRKRSPMWRGVKKKLIYKFPKATKLWEEYQRIFIEDCESDGDGAIATGYYKEHREEMDEGAEASWEDGFAKDGTEISAIQHCMNLLYRDEAAFWCEQQNEPLPDDGGVDRITAKGILGNNINGYSRGTIPVTADRLTVGVDVHKSLLYWSVIAWEDDFTGYVVDYGAWPKQRRRHYALRNVKASLQTKYKGRGLEAQVQSALDDLWSSVISIPYLRDDGAELKVDKCLVDANWAPSTEVVYSWCRQFGGGVVMPSHGQGITASQMPLSGRKRARGEKAGLNWRVPRLKGRKTRYVLFDANYWKTFLSKRLGTAQGDAGSLSMFKPDGKLNKEQEHLMAAEHLVAEYPVETEGRGRKTVEWKMPTHKPDNHLLDTTVLAYVAASMEGVKVPGHGEIEARQDAERKVTMGSLARNKSKKAQRPIGGRDGKPIRMSDKLRRR